MKFVKKHLYTKDSKQLIDNYLQTIPLLETVRNEGELLLDRALSDEELTMLANNTKQFVLDLKADIKKHFVFPKADDSFNLKTLGTDYADLDLAISNLPPNDFKYQVIDSRIQPLDSEIMRLKDSQKVFTKNPKQNQVLKVCQDLSTNLNKLDKLNGLGAAFFAERLTNQLLLIGYEDEKTVLVVNYEKIEYI